MSSVKIPYSEQALKNEVKRKPILWDKSDPAHKKRNLVLSAWYEVANRFTDNHVDGK